MATLTALIIIVCLKERSLCQRRMYLVIIQTVAAMFSGGAVGSLSVAFWRAIVKSLNATSLKAVNVWFNFIPTASVTEPCLYPLGADARNVSSISASPHERGNIWSNYCKSLALLSYDFLNYIPAFKVLRHSMTFYSHTFHFYCIAS